MTFDLNDGQSFCFHHLQYGLWFCFYYYLINQWRQSIKDSPLTIEQSSYQFTYLQQPRLLTHLINFSWRPWVHLIRFLLEKIGPEDPEPLEVEEPSPKCLVDDSSCWDLRSLYQIWIGSWNKHIWYKRKPDMMYAHKNIRIKLSRELTSGSFCLSEVGWRGLPIKVALSPSNWTRSSERDVLPPKLMEERCFWVFSQYLWCWLLNK